MKCLKDLEPLIVKEEEASGQQLAKEAFKAIDILLERHVENQQNDRKQDSSEDALTPGRMQRKILSDNAEMRDYELYIPKEYDQNKVYSMIVILHGTELGEAYGRIAAQTDMNTVADSLGFIAVYPIAKRQSAYWGAVDISSWNSPEQLNVMKTDETYSDIDYLDDVLSDVRKIVNVDESRISAIGFSAGGMFIQRYHLNRPGKLSSLASVSGTYLGDVPEESAQGLPVLILHGMTDEVLPYYGGTGLISVLGEGVFDAVVASRPNLQKELWIKQNGCNREPRVTYSKYGIVSSYNDCKSGSVREYQFRNLGHSFPRFLTYSENNRVNTSKMLAEFLLAQKLR